MNIIICGAGKVGFSISKQLSAQGHSVTVIDQSSEDIKKINDSHSYEEKIELLKVLWELVVADSLIDPYEENLYFKIAELIKVKRTIATKNKQKNSQELTHTILPLKRTDGRSKGRVAQQFNMNPYVYAAGSGREGARAEREYLAIHSSAVRL